VTNIPDARPASTVVLLRDTHNGMETLMLKRNKALMFAGGLWVFPGGALEPADIEEAGGDMNTAARIAAAREAEEECGLRPDLKKMVHLSRWTTPVVEPKRFQTWIYAAPLAESAEVEIDGSEIHDFCWIGVADAVAQHENGAAGHASTHIHHTVQLTALSEYCGNDRGRDSAVTSRSISHFHKRRWCRSGTV